MLTPEQMEEAVEAMARAMLGSSRPNAGADDLTPASRGTFGAMPKWRLYEPLARAAVTAALPVIERVVLERAAAYHESEAGRIDAVRGAWTAGQRLVDISGGTAALVHLKSADAIRALAGEER